MNQRRAQSKMALLVVDVQNDFKRDASYYECPMLDKRLLSRIRNLIDFCRTKNIPVMFTRHTILPDKSDAEIGEPESVRACILGTDGWQVAPEVDPRTDDLYVNKHRFDAFYRSNLEDKLRELGADTVVICGVWSNNCVRATAEGAYYRNYKLVIVSDCCGAKDFVAINETNENWLTWYPLKRLLAQFASRYALRELKYRTYLTELMTLKDFKIKYQAL